MALNGLLTRRQVLGTGVAAAAALLHEAPARAQTGRNPKFIVDTQVNVWSGGKPPAYRIQGPFLAKDLLAQMSEAGVQRAIIVPVSWNPDGEKTPIDAAKANPDKLRVFSIYDVNNPNAAATAASVAHQDGVLGLRLFLNSKQGAAWLQSDAAKAFFPVAESAGIPVMIFPAYMPAVHDIAVAHPNLRLCIDSLGAAPDKTDITAFNDYDGVLALGKLPNVSIKAADIAYFSKEAYPFKNMEPVLRKAYDAFGPERMFWGSDITMLPSLHITYAQCISSFTEMSWLTDKDLDQIMGQSFCKWANWPVSA